MTGLIQFLPWDSRFFGFRIARLGTSTLTSALTREALEQCTHKKIKCLYFLARADHAPTIRLAEASGFQLVDARLDFVWEKGPRPAIEAGLRFRLARAKDAVSLGRLAMTSYPHSRFASDPRFPRGADQRLFQQWVTRSITGAFDDCVWIAEKDRTLAGFISCKRAAPGVGRIGLISVAPRKRLRHVGTALVGQALKWFDEKNISKVTVTTQGTNLAAQRLYQRCGFRAQEFAFWYHRWFDGVAA